MPTWTLWLNAGIDIKTNCARGAKEDFNVVIQTERKGTLRALEAADFAAWSVGKVLRQYDIGTVGKLRRDFEKWISRIPYDHQHMSLRAKPTRAGTSRAPSLGRFCQEYGVPQR